MMTRFVFTLLIGLVVSLGTTAAFAETFECKRYTDDAHGFTTYSAFESWFPKRINLSPYGWDAAGSGSKAVLKQKNKRKYRLLPNGKMIAGMEPNPGFKTVDNVRYKCDRTSLQLAAGLKNEHETESTVKTTVGDEVIASVPIQSNTTNPEDDPFAKTKATCSEIGFTAGTEK